MLIAISAALSFGILLVAAGFAAPMLIRAWERHRRGWLDDQCGRKVIVHTKSERTIEGVMVTVARDGVILRAASLVEPQTVELAGEPFIPRGEIFFIQLPV